MDPPERTVLGRGRRGYWQVVEVKRKETGREIILKASGTPSESFLRSLSGVQNRQLRVHLCGDPWISPLQPASRGRLRGYRMESKPRGGSGERGRRRAQATTSQCRGVETTRKGSWGTSGKGEEARKVSWDFGRRRKEKEEETKEDGFPHPSQEEFGQSVRFHRARSKGRDQAEGEKEGQKGSHADQEQEKGCHRREAAAPARVPRVARWTTRICSNLPHRLNGFGDNARERLR